MYSNFGPRRQLDLVSLSAVLLSIAAGIAGVGLLLYRPLILQELIVPFVESTYSRDGVITEASIRQLDRWLRMMVPVAFVIACLSIGYALLWRYFSAHLQAEGSQQGDSTPPIRAFEFSCLAATLMLATIMRSHDGILTRSLTYDEIFTALKFVEVDSLWTTVSAYRTTNNHIAYSVLASIAQSLFGRHEWSFRLPALILGLGSIVALWTFIRHFFGGRLALLGALGLALSPVHTIWSTTGRGYTGMILFTTISSYLFLRLVNRALFRDAVLFTAASVLAIYFQLLAALVTGVQILFVVCLAIRERFGIRGVMNLSRTSFRMLWGSFAAIVGLVVVCYTPVLPKLVLEVTDKGKGGIQPSFPLGVAQLYSGYADGPVLIMLVATAAIGLVFLRRLSYLRETDYLTLLFILPLVVLWFSPVYYAFPRFMAHFLPNYILLVAAGFCALWQLSAKIRGLGRYVLRSVVCIAALSTLSEWSSKSWANMEAHGFREAAWAMGAESQDRRSTALCSILGSDELYQYYSRKRIVVVHTIREFEELANRHDETRCAYFVPDRGKAAGNELLEFVTKNSESQLFGRSIVFTYRPRGS
jgi:hypothetical protein